MISCSPAQFFKTRQASQNPFSGTMYLCGSLRGFAMQLVITVHDSRPALRQCALCFMAARTDS